MYNLECLIKNVNLPLSYLELAMPLLEDDKVNHKVLKTLYNNKKDYVIINNTRAKDINGYASITNTPIPLLEFDLALKNVLQTQLL